ncbi:MAG: hypothetical protein ACO1NW_17830 [Chitinophagaceae bacterium]
MKQFMLLAGVLLMAALPICCFAQHEPDITVTDIRSFVLKKIDTNGLVLVNGDLKVEYKARYSSKDKKYVLYKGSDDSSSFDLVDPLNRIQLRSEITKQLNEGEETGFAISEYSIEQVAIWLYSLKYVNDAPKIGRLNIGFLTIPGDNDVTNSDERQNEIETANNRNSLLSVQSLGMKKRINEQVDSLMSAYSKYPPGASKADSNNILLKYNYLKDLKRTLKEVVYVRMNDDLEKLIDTVVIKTGSPAFVNDYHQQFKERFYKLDTINMRIEDLQNEMRVKEIYPIEKVSILFERGHLERIQAWVQNRNGGLDIYENIYAIGFTSIDNFKKFNKMRLFVRSRNTVKCIYLSDVITSYDNLLDLYTRDYSPADTVINDFIPANGPIVLYKAQSTKLFETRVFSDLQGVSEKEPNGLIQVEIARKFNLNTNRIQLTARGDYNLFTYINLSGAISKIEKKARYLPLQNEKTIQNDVITSPSYATNLDLRRYENASLQLDVNTFLIDYPDSKITAYLDLGIRYGHVPLEDTVYTVANGVLSKSEKTDQFSGHTVTFMLPKINIEFFSERRVGFNVVYNFNHTYALTNNKFKQIMSYAKSDLNNILTERKARNSHTAEVFLRAETSRDGNGQLFFRSRFFWQKGDANTFFSQVQLGYAYNIIYRK